MGTVNTLSVPIQYTFYPPLSSPLPFSSPPSPPSSPTHRYIVKIYRNLKGTKYSWQVHKTTSYAQQKIAINCTFYSYIYTLFLECFFQQYCSLDSPEIINVNHTSTTDLPPSPPLSPPTIPL